MGVENHTDGVAGFQFLAVAAGFVSIFQGAFPNFTDLFAVCSLSSFNTAAVAVDHFWEYFYIVEFAPFFCDFFSKHVIVVYRSHSCFTCFAVKTADSNKFTRHDLDLTSVIQGFV